LHIAVDVGIAEPFDRRSDGGAEALREPIEHGAGLFEHHRLILEHDPADLFLLWF